MPWFIFGLISMIAAACQWLWWRNFPFRGTGWLLPRFIPSVRGIGEAGGLRLLVAAEARLVVGRTGWRLAVPFGCLVFALSVISKVAAERRLSLVLTTVILVGAYFSVRRLLQVGVTLLMRGDVDRVVSPWQVDRHDPRPGS
jgi:hypothetical protein